MNKLIGSLFVSLFACAAAFGNATVGANQGSSYTLPAATINSRGGVIVPSNSGLSVSPNGSISVNTSGIAITYTGTPVTPFIIQPELGYIAVPAASASGSNTYSTTPMVSIATFQYSENLFSSTGNHLLTISFDNLVSVGVNGFGAPSCPLLTSFSCPELVSVIGNFGGSGAPLLTTYSCPKLKYVRSNFGPGTFPALTTLSFPLLEYVQTNFLPGPFLGVTTWNFPALAYVGNNVNPSNFPLLTSLTLPALVECGGLYQPGTMALLTTLTANSLANVGNNFNPNTMASLTTLSFPALAKVGGTIVVSAMASLTTVSLPALVSVASTITFTTTLGNITTVTLGTIGVTKSYGGNISFNGQKLTNASENQILGVVATLDGTNGTTAFHFNVNIAGGTNAVTDATGLALIATIVANGGTVTHN